MKIRILVLALIIGAPAIAFTQKIRVIEGSVKQLKGQANIKIDFTYDSLIIGRDMPESTFIQNKKTSWDKKEAGKAEQWEQYWFVSRKNLYEDIFRYYFSKNSGLAIGDQQSTYTLVFKTMRTEPGWNTGIVSSLPIIDGEAWFVTTADPNKVITKISFKDFKGTDLHGGDFEMGTRIQSAYVTAGKELGMFIKGKLK